MFSKACEYALKIMLHLSTKESGEAREGLKGISQAIGSPEAFSAKILQQLVKHDLLESVRGPSGGFQIPNNREIKLSEVVIAIDGAGIMTDCVLGLKECSENRPCPVHEKFKAVRDHLSGVLISTTLNDISEDIINGESFLKH